MAERELQPKKIHRISHFDPFMGLQAQLEDGHLTLSERAGHLASSGERDADYFETPTGAKLLDRISRENTRRITTEYIDASLHHPERFWENCLTKADQFIEDYMITLLFPNKRNSAELLDEVRLTTGNPAIIIPEIASQSNLEKTHSNNARYRFELLRKLVVARLIAGIRSQSHEAQQRKELLEIHHQVLASKLFKDSTGVLHTSVTYAVHENETGRVLGLLSERPSPDKLQPGTHVRTYDDQARRVDIKGETLDVLCHIREKTTSATVAKMLRYATESSEGIIKPEVNDIKGMLFVVKRVESSFDPKVSGLVDKATDEVVKYLGKQYGEKNVTVEVDDRNGNPEHPSQSPHIRYQRRIIHVTSRQPIELIFYGEGDYINNDYHVGTLNPETGFYTGGARSLFTKERLMRLLPILFPEEIGGQPIEGYQGLLDEAKRQYGIEAARLLAIR